MAKNIGFRVKQLLFGQVQCVERSWAQQRRHGGRQRAEQDVHRPLAGQHPAHQRRNGRACPGQVRLAGLCFSPRIKFSQSMNSDFYFHTNYDLASLCACAVNCSDVINDM